MYPTMVILLVEMSNSYAQRTLCMDDIPTLPIPQASVNSPTSKTATTVTLITVDGAADGRSGDNR